MSVSGITETSQYLTFTLDEELFALDISKVREVLEFTSATKVPRTPEFMRGVINLRGSVVPVVDLRVKFGMSRTEKGIDTCVIIADVAVDGERTTLGALADSVQEVLELDPVQIDPPPRIGTRLDTAFIKGMGKRDDDFLILLDIDRVFTAEEVSPMASLTEQAAGEAA
jgi:purine-binding chemotaxis protein CheW